MQDLVTELDAAERGLAGQQVRAFGVVSGSGGDLGDAQVTVGQGEGGVGGFGEVLFAMAGQVRPGVLAESRPYRVPAARGPSRRVSGSRVEGR